VGMEGNRVHVGTFSKRRHTKASRSRYTTLSATRATHLDTATTRECLAAYVEGSDD
jgi:hypothetical protein